MGKNGRHRFPAIFFCHLIDLQLYIWLVGLGKIAAIQYPRLPCIFGKS
ncbi:hypothetical protein AB434_1219 [Heyndrickxia coagulans]|uniref:Uncharacterized protein n=1 Tax=Heyndrickxia coagulans TaxID=1398 RepID=A0A0C5CGX4_HEYCO|nr:hypothetical protein SB48_HM08orf06554 [Heyndrickxia coagulans]AKN53624.1 hypothetical protein AB434_1219 [Heyndrickxia coagulans]KWZ80020.1 hypothetical protein HMPREF3213_02371 [Heyndrickxia coagulans]KYC64514.1 hypothetical protein B4100_1306 [Heyndrickxia coagulans]KYC70521.1 hypothetical protein B4096_1264 [Heyndrickxia coagulans]